MDEAIDPCGFLLSEDPIIVTCNVCSKPVLQSGLLSHLENCKLVNPDAELFATFAQSIAPETPPVKKKRKREQPPPAAVAASTVPVPSSTTAAAPSPEEKEKTTKQVKTESRAKVKGPIDLDKQCGVPLETGLLCQRSITCKIHSVSAKRSVVGRTQQYDVLLQEYTNKGRAEGKYGGLNPTKPASTARREVNTAIVNIDVTTTEEETTSIFDIIATHRPLAVSRPQPLSLDSMLRSLTSNAMTAMLRDIRSRIDRHEYGSNNPNNVNIMSNNNNINNVNSGITSQSSFM
ncbi:hypothetical protein HDU76_001256 [Blyttiomyces sp. JEL0837]|nr:hypothetical protein HDU76_001256 [Blyttiomyces sp. JEL0837]